MWTLKMMILILIMSVTISGCAGVMGALKEHSGQHEGISSVCFRGLAVPYGRVLLTHAHITKDSKGTAEISEACNIKLEVTE